MEFVLELCAVVCVAAFTAMLVGLVVLFFVIMKRIDDARHK